MEQIPLGNELAWQTNCSTAERFHYIRTLASFLKGLSPNIPDEKILDLSKQFEGSVFLKASSKDMYLATLQRKLSEINEQRARAALAVANNESGGLVPPNSVPAAQVGVSTGQVQGTPSTGLPNQAAAIAAITNSLLPNSAATSNAPPVMPNSSAASNPALLPNSTTAVPNSAAMSSTAAALLASRAMLNPGSAAMPNVGGGQFNNNTMAMLKQMASMPNASAQANAAALANLGAMPNATATTMPNAATTAMPNAAAATMSNATAATMPNSTPSSVSGETPPSSTPAPRTITDQSVDLSSKALTDKVRQILNGVEEPGPQLLNLETIRHAGKLGLLALARGGWLTPTELALERVEKLREEWKKNYKPSEPIKDMSEADKKEVATVIKKIVPFIRGIEQLVQMFYAMTGNREGTLKLIGIEMAFMRQWKALSMGVYYLMPKETMIVYGVLLRYFGFVRQCVRAFMPKLSAESTSSQGVEGGGGGGTGAGATTGLEANEEDMMLWPSSASSVGSTAPGDKGKGEEMEVGKETASGVTGGGTLGVGGKRPASTITASPPTSTTTTTTAASSTIKAEIKSSEGGAGPVMQPPPLQPLMALPPDGVVHVPGEMLGKGLSVKDLRMPPAKKRKSESSTPSSSSSSSSSGGPKKENIKGSGGTVASQTTMSGTSGGSGGGRTGRRASGVTSKGGTTAEMVIPGGGTVMGPGLTTTSREMTEEKERPKDPIEYVASVLRRLGPDVGTVLNATISPLMEGLTGFPQVMDETRHSASSSSSYASGWAEEWEEWLG
ncbi:MAG: hypothetical protein DHS80DRAFT_24470 [Piptocephalis tieghemiana]|nr:MAG: hypothetical protein DHS80DRAFT_24470 [Piptocephalis tieghemiana]